LKKKGVVRILVIFQDTHMFSLIIQNAARRELSFDVAKHRSILKNKGV